MNKTLYLTLVLLINGITHAQDAWVLDGYVQGYEGKVKILLNFIMPNHEADMVNEQTLFMVDGRFRVEGLLPAPALLSIRIRPEMSEDVDPSSFESTFIWVDNKAMTLHGNKGNFAYSDVTGYPRQDQNEAHNIYVRDRLKDRERRIDSLSSSSSETALEELNQMNSVSKVHLRNKYRLDYCYLFPNSFLSVYNYSWFTKWIPEMVPKAHATAFYKSLDNDLRENTYGKQIKHYLDHISINKKLSTGERPYDFALQDSSGKEMTLNSLDGKVVLLDFWSSRCGPCRKEHKNYLDLYNKFDELGFEILSVSQDRNKEQWIKAMRKDHIIWPSLWDESMTISKYMYLVTAIPQNYLISREGIIVGENIKGKDLADRLEKIFNSE